MTEKSIHFSKAPIVEAVLAFEIEMQPKDLLPRLAAFGAHIGDSYGERSEIRAHQVKLGIEGVSDTDSTVLGYRFRSKDNQHVVQVRLNGFAFSRLDPYDRWEAFRDEAHRLWRLYRQVVPFGAIQVFATRYINRLVVPAGRPINEYLNVYPSLPPEPLPQQGPLAFVRLQLYIPEPQGELTIQVQTVPSGETDKDAYILDNDLRFPAVGLSEETIWKRLETARNLKNDYFFAEITEEMKGLIS